LPVFYFVNAHSQVVKVELRRAVRYRLDLPVTFRWASRCGEGRLGMGFTRDISSASIFVFCENCPPPDAYVSCEVMLSRPEGQGYCQIFASGRVLRTEQNLQRRVSGFALLGDMLMLNSELFEASEQSIGSDALVGNSNQSN
jgi:hypothetical protein